MKDGGIGGKFSHITQSERRTSKVERGTMTGQLPNMAQRWMFRMSEKSRGK